MLFLLPIAHTTVVQLSVATLHAFKMYTKLFTVALLSTSTLAMQGFINHPSFGVMLTRGNAIAKRQGYYPDSDPCTGDGTTCAEVCGVETVACPSNDPLVLSCHSALDGTHCYPDNSGSESTKLSLERPVANPGRSSLLRKSSSMIRRLWPRRLLHLRYCRSNILLPRRHRSSRLRY
jgi:hypothetical protein